MWRTAKRVLLAAGLALAAGRSDAAGARDMDQRLQMFLQSSTPSGLQDESTVFSRAFVSLHEGKAQQVIVYLQGRYWCGPGGCTLLVLEPVGDTFKVVSKVSPVLPAIGVMPSRSAGWRDLSVQVGGGGVKPGTVRLPFSGKTYAKNPALAPAMPLESSKAGRILIAKPGGMPLFP